MTTSEKNLSVTIPRDLLLKSQDAASEACVTLDEWVREAIERRVNQMELPLERRGPDKP